jgi:hypothetical protein
MRRLPPQLGSTSRGTQPPFARLPAFLSMSSVRCSHATSPSGASLRGTTPRDMAIGPQQDRRVPTGPIRLGHPAIAVVHHSLYPKRIGCSGADCVPVRYLFALSARRMPPKKPCNNALNISGSAARSGRGEPIRAGAPTTERFLLAADDRRHPVGCVARRSGFARLALKIVDHGNRGEALTVAQAVRIDDRSCSLGTFRDCRDKDAAATADQKIANAGSEPVIFDQRPIVGPNLE